MALKKFYRSTTDRRVAGLFGGLGEAFGIDATYLRLAFIVLALVTGVVPALIGYGLGWLITLEEPGAGSGTSEPGFSSTGREDGAREPGSPAG
jgi:phage shock protein C